MLKKKFNSTNPTIYLTARDSSRNFRFAITDTYKANRKKICIPCQTSGEDYTISPYGVVTNDDGGKAMYYKCDRCEHRIKDTKPVYYLEMRKYLITKFNATVCEWGEADDNLCINTLPNTVIVSNDKDLLMCPAYHYRLSDNKLIRSNDPGTLYLSSDSKKILGVGFKWFAAQMLLGDTVDNIIKPQKGLGPKAVYTYLKDIESPKELWDAVCDIYTRNNKSDMIEINAKLLWMARKPKQIFNVNIVGELESEYRSIKESQGKKPTETRS